MNVTRKGKKERKRTVETEDYEDDDDEDDSDNLGGEDIAIEEDMEKETTSSTTETPEKDQMKLKMVEEVISENNSNDTQLLDEDDEYAGSGCDGRFFPIAKQDFGILFFILLLQLNQYSFRYFK